jgi:hypothetical protein
MSSTFSIVKINGTALPGTVNGTFDERENDDLRDDDGQLHVTSASVKRSAPMASWSTVCLRTLFGVLGTGDEVPYVALDGTNGLDMLGAEGDTAPGLASGSVHARRRFLNGLVLLDKISYRPDSIAEASCSAYAKAAAGGTDPVTRTDAAAPTIPLNTERLVLTAATINGTSALRKLQSLDIDIAHQVENNDPGQSCYDGGLPFPVLLKQPGAGGPISVRFAIETQDLTTSFANGTAVFTFAVLNHQGVGVSASTAIVTLNTCLVRSRRINGPKGAASRLIEGIATFDGTNRPCTLSVA